ncbi:MAG TPA: hypothetical protein VMF06_23295 [Candidatus Limnocylindria bacterium]|jgi:hypothetical protein|nr:hypothetical protein [Candidatus Limnocylindria bacterium]
MRVFLLLFPPGRGRSMAPVLGTLAAAVWLLGCAGPALAPVNLAEAGWTVREAQVVWRPRRAAPELVGELLVATNSDGRQLIQFSKQTLPVVTAQVASNGWNLSSPLRHGRYGGRLPPTDRVPWFELAQWPPAPQLDSRWRLEMLTNAAWRLGNPRTGESVEGSTP